jgi:hypothetical protein
MLDTNVLDLLKGLDAVLVSRDPTVIDAFTQALVLSKIAEPNGLHGPLQKMYFELCSIRRELDKLKWDMEARQQRSVDGTKWVSPYPSYTTTTADLSGYWREPNMYFGGIKDTTVEAASPTDPDAFVLTDPDTGDSMSVKYK